MGVARDVSRKTRDRTIYDQRIHFKFDTSCRSKTEQTIIGEWELKWWRVFWIIMGGIREENWSQEGWKPTYHWAFSTKTTASSHGLETVLRREQAHMVWQLTSSKWWSVSTPRKLWVLPASWNPYLSHWVAQEWPQVCFRQTERDASSFQD